MKKSRRKLQSCTNQIGKGDRAPNFELVIPPADNFFQLEVIQSKSFKQSHAAREITYRAKLKNPSDDVPLNNLLPHLQALFETILQETKREYGDAGVMRIYISHPKLEKSIIIPPTYLGYLNSQKILDYIDTVLYSAGEIPADDELIVNAAVVEFVTGSGRKAIWMSFSHTPLFNRRGAFSLCYFFYQSEWSPMGLRAPAQRSSLDRCD